MFYLVIHLIFSNEAVATPAKQDARLQQFQCLCFPSTSSHTKSAGHCKSLKHFNFSWKQGYTEESENTQPYQHLKPSNNHRYVWKISGEYPTTTETQPQGAKSRKCAAATRPAGNVHQEGSQDDRYGRALRDATRWPRIWKKAALLYWVLFFCGWCEINTGFWRTLSRFFFKDISEKVLSCQQRAVWWWRE